MTRLRDFDHLLTGISEGHLLGLGFGGLLDELIALKDIPPGQEFTIDYRTLIDDTDTGVYNDAATAQPIKGFPARETLLRTTRQMLELVESLNEDWQG